MKKEVGFILLMLALLFLGFAVWEELPYLQNQRKMDNLREKHTEEEPDQQDPHIERKIDFEELKQINEDIVGWIYIPETPIDYPIVQNNYDDEYLSKDYTGTYSIVGSIFMRTSVKADFTGQHTILYGHNLVDNQMFGWLSEYASSDVKKSHPSIYIYLSDKKVLRGDVYSAYECADRTDTYRTQFNSVKEFRQWKEMVATLGNVPNQGIDARQILTLSTCTDRGDARFVVHSALQRIK